MAKAKPLCSTDFNETTEARFWSKVDRRGPDECWEWQGSISSRPDSGNYGDAYIGAGGPSSRTQLSHRVAWCLANPGVSTGELIVLHSCDNPPCCNPNHLSLGTSKQNTRQMFDRGRDGLTGERHPVADYSDREVASAVIRVFDGEAQRRVARSLGSLDLRSSVNNWTKGKTRHAAHMEALLCVNT